VPLFDCRPGDEIAATFSTELRIGAGSYSVSVALHAAAVHIDASYDWWDRAVVFRVDLPRETPFTGVAALPVRVDVARRDER
jgi:lipopolysaccharide transport system ATP-binding protein